MILATSGVSRTSAPGLKIWVFDSTKLSERSNATSEWRQIASDSGFVLVCPGRYGARHLTRAQEVQGKFIYQPVQADGPDLLNLPSSSKAHYAVDVVNFSSMKSCKRCSRSAISVLKLKIGIEVTLAGVEHVVGLVLQIVHQGAQRGSVVSMPSIFDL